jgi:tetratricopeptide (TPR) repeat protein
MEANPKSDRKASAVAYAELGEALRSVSKFDEALTAYKEAVSRGGDLWDAYYGRALTYIQLKQPALATDDLQTVATRGTDPALRDSAVARLKDLGVTRTPPTPAVGRARRVFVQYVSEGDKPVVDELLGLLANKQRSMPGAERTGPRTTGDVRSFFPQDREAAAALKQDTERALAKLGYDIKLSQLDLDSKAFPKAQEGTLELWLPALTSYERQPLKGACYFELGDASRVLAKPACEPYLSKPVERAKEQELRARYPECGKFLEYACWGGSQQKAP